MSTVPLRTFWSSIIKGRAVCSNHSLLYLTNARFRAALFVPCTLHSNMQHATSRNEKNSGSNSRHAPFPDLSAPSVLFFVGFYVEGLLIRQNQALVALSTLDNSNYRPGRTALFFRSAIFA